MNYMYQHTCRRRQKYKHCEKEKACLPLQLTAVSPWPNEAQKDDILDGSTQPGGAECAIVVSDTTYVTVPAVQMYGECVSGYNIAIHKGRPLLEISAHEHSDFK